MRLIVLILAVVLSGCASRPFIVNTAVPLSFEHLDIQAESLTAKDGDLIFQGTPRAAVTAVLLEAVEQEVPVRRNAFHRLESGAELYLIKTKGNPASTYCSTRETFTSQAPIGPVAGQSCFMDEDGDNAFESVWLGPLTTNPMMKFSGSAPKIALGMIQDKTPLSQPIPYELVDDLEIEGGMYGIKYKAIRRGDAMLNKVLIKGERQFPFAAFANANNFVEFSESDLPKTIDFIGMRIELLGLQEGDLTYKIVGPADASNPFIDYQSFPCADDINEMCEKGSFD